MNDLLRGIEALADKYEAESGETMFLGDVAEEIRALIAAEGAREPPRLAEMREQAKRLPTSLAAQQAYINGLEFELARAMDPAPGERVARALVRAYWQGRGETLTKEQEDEFWLSWGRDADAALAAYPAPLDAVQDDIAAMLRAAGLGDHARSVSAHAVVRDELLPWIKAHASPTPSPAGLREKVRHIIATMDSDEADRTKTYDQLCDDAADRILRLCGEGELRDAVRALRDEFARYNPASAFTAKEITVRLDVLTWAYEDALQRTAPAEPDEKDDPDPLCDMCNDTGEITVYETGGMAIGKSACPRGCKPSPGAPAQKEPGCTCNHYQGVHHVDCPCGATTTLKEQET